MASAIDICNLALSHFGQDGVISAISPPDGSAEAEHCARFYPIARDELLEMHPWTFASKRATLAELTNDREDFEYRYAVPADCLKPRRLLPDGYDDEDHGSTFEWEGSSLYADESLATLVYTYKLTDTTKFSPLFVTALSYLLASYVVGPIRKDETGRSQQSLRQMGEALANRAAASNANADRRRASHTSTAKAAR